MILSLTNKDKLDWFSRYGLNQFRIKNHFKKIIYNIFIVELIYDQETIPINVNIKTKYINYVNHYYILKNSEAN